MVRALTKRKFIAKAIKPGMGFYRIPDKFPIVEPDKK